MICGSGVWISAPGPWIPAFAGMTRGESGNDGLAGKFQKCGHLRTFQDIQTWQAAPEEASMSMLGAESLLSGVFSVINRHVFSLPLLDLSTSDGTLCCTGNMVERCFTTWQAGSVSVGRSDPRRFAGAGCYSAGKSFPMALHMSCPSCWSPLPEPRLERRIAGGTCQDWSLNRWNRPPRPR